MEQKQWDITLNKVCDFNYLTEMMGRKKHLILEIIDVFLEQVPAELKGIEQAISKTDYPIIKNFAHTMKSSVSIMGITVLAPILHEMEKLSAESKDIERITELSQQLSLICKQAIGEIEKEKHNYK